MGKDIMLIFLKQCSVCKVKKFGGEPRLKVRKDCIVDGDLPVLLNQEQNCSQKYGYGCSLLSHEKRQGIKLPEMCLRVSNNE